MTANPTQSGTAPPADRDIIPRRAASPRGRRAAIAIIIVVTVAFQVPFVNRGLSPLDEGSVVSIADALWYGESLYRDRITPLAPLTYQIMHGLYAVFGPHLLVGRLLQLSVFTLCAVMIFAVLLEAVPLRWAFWGALALLPVKAIGFPLWTIVNYSQIAILWCLIAVWSTCRALDTGRFVWFLVTGLAVGLTAITKQNLGLYIAATVGGSIVLDALRSGPGWLRSVCVPRGLAVLVGMLIPLSIEGAHFAVQGTLYDLFDRAIVGLSYLTTAYYVPFPDLSIWTLDAQAFPPKVFAYFPSPLLQLWLEGSIDLRSMPVALLIEHAVKAAYYAPMLVLAVEVFTLARFRRNAIPRTEWSRRVILAGFATMAYASIAYRADWVHLVNISPPILILCVTGLWRAGRATGRLRYAGAGAAVMWLILGAVMSAIVIGAHRTPIETARGTILATPGEAAAANRILAWVERQPPDQVLAFLRSEPLYYFLTDRRNPIPFQLLLVGFLRAEDDPEIARLLSGVDQVIYNPKSLPTGAVPIASYAPETARLLSSRFEVVDVLGMTAFVMKRTAGVVAPEHHIVDLVGRFDALRSFREVVGRARTLPDGSSARVDVSHWLTHPTIRATAVGRTTRTCFDFEHEVGTNETIVSRPVLDPVFAASAGGDAPRVRFEITIVRDGGFADTLFNTTHSGAIPGPIIRASLHPYAGERVTVRFCTAIAGDPAGEATYAPAAWVEPRIIRTALH